MLPASSSFASLGSLAAANDSSPVGSILTWSAVLLVILVLAFLGYAQLKRWMSSSTDEGPAEGFTFSDLRELHRTGQLSDAEYESARVQLLGSTQRAAGALPDVLPPGRRVTPRGSPNGPKLR